MDAVVWRKRILIMLFFIGMLWLLFSVFIWERLQIQQQLHKIDMFILEQKTINCAWYACCTSQVSTELLLLCVSCPCMLSVIMLMIYVICIIYICSATVFTLQSHWGIFRCFFLSSCWAVQCSISAVLYLLLLILYWFGHLIYEYWKGHMLD